MRTLFPSTADIGGIDPVAAIAAEFDDADVVFAAIELAFESAGRYRKAFAEDDAAGKKTSIRTGRGGKTPVARLASAERRKNQGRIYDKNFCFVIGLNVEPH